jgi:hypothetical protein
VKKKAFNSAPPLKDVIEEFKAWIERVPCEELAKLVMDAYWKHDEPFEKSELVRYFLLERAGHTMIRDPRSQARLSAVKELSKR